MLQSQQENLEQGQAAGQRDTEMGETPPGSRTEREELQNTAWEPETERQQRKKKPGTKGQNTGTGNRPEQDGEWDTRE